MRFSTVGDTPISPEWVEVFLNSHRAFPGVEHASDRAQYLRENGIPSWAASRLRSEWCRLPADAQAELLKEE